jgi:hypothetical protein
LRDYVKPRIGLTNAQQSRKLHPVVIYSESPNCFKARAVSERFDEFDRMIQGMRDRGVKVEILEDRGLTKRFCIN